MLVAVGPELTAAMQHCVATDVQEANGWGVDAWRVDTLALEALVNLYNAALAGGLGATPMTDAIEQVLARAGVDIRPLLVDSSAELPRVTRADFSEFAAAASLLAMDGWPRETTFMPNLPKASRGKSESGIDVMAIELDSSLMAADLTDEETLRFASVKHTIQESVGDLKSKLKGSVTTEWTAPYVMSQLRVLQGRLEAAGTASSQRVYLHYPEHPDRTHIHAIAVVDADAVDAFLSDVSFLPVATRGVRRLRVIGIPDLASVHERCN